MSRNNVKLLTNAQLFQFNEKYIFEYNDKDVIVKNKFYTRITHHPRNKTFSINSKIRKISFTPMAIETWIELDKLEPNRYTLIDVQQAVNRLYITYQPSKLTDVKKLLNK